MPTNSTSYWGIVSCGWSTNSINEKGVGHDDRRRSPLVAIDWDSLIGSSRQPSLLAERRPREILFYSVVRRELCVNHRLHRIPRDAAGRVPAALPVAAGGCHFPACTAGSRCVSPSLHHDLSLSWIGTDRAHERSAGRQPRVGVAAGPGCYSSLPPPQRPMANGLVGHRDLRPRRLVRAVGGRRWSAGFFHCLSGDVRRSVASGAISRRPPHGLDTVAGQ